MLNFAQLMMLKGKAFTNTANFKIQPRIYTLISCFKVADYFIISILLNMFFEEQY